MQQKSQGINFTKRPYIEDVGPRKIESISFAMFSESEISKSAEVQVYLDKYYDSTRKPVESGLLDPRMGAANKMARCSTCHGNFSDCPGHYGYLSLALPVFNIGYLSTIMDVLKCICKSCSRILLDDKLRDGYLKKMRSPRMEHLHKYDVMKTIVKKCSSMASSKAVKCPRCGAINGMVKKAPLMLGILHDRSKFNDASLEEFRSAISHVKETGTGTFNLTTYLLNPVRVLSLFKRIPHADCELLYLSDRPEKMMITNIAVPPIALRPSVLVDDSQTNENDTTERLKLIIHANACLRQELHESTSFIKCLTGWESLQAEVALYINSEARGVVPTNPQSKPLSGFVQRLKGKHGRFRGNLSGKRVEFTGRTVISPDPNLKITEVAIPSHMARILTYPERVSRHNIEKLKQCVRNGSYKYPGARLIVDPNGVSTVPHGDFRRRLAEELKYGTVVHRYLEDGDLVLFNRQPSLHRMSLMCHKARIMPGRTLRFNESVCNPYNADFDGDEMNMHVPQTEEARTEALMLMGVQNNLCTPKNGEILVASTQDFLTSSFLITRKDTFYDRASFSLMCCYMGDAMESVDLPTPAILKPIELWTGKQLFSVLVRPNASVKVYLNLALKEKSYTMIEIEVEGKKKKIESETMCINDGFVYFRNSELISGQLGKATLGNGNKDGLYSILLRDYKSHAAAACMNRLAKLSARWIGNHGFSIGIDDVQPGKILNDQKGAKIIQDYQKCDSKILEFDKGKLELRAGCDAVQTLEVEITGILNEIRDEVSKFCMKGLHWRNSPLIMSQCGSKGSPINICQMVACVGQQSVGGKRAPDGFIDRSLPHFPRQSKLPSAKGFVANSFYTGLTATEFFFHTMGGREGLVDTAVKTAETGYMSRRIMKALEDLSVHYDVTVRNASGCIIQFVYGDDSMDPAQMEGKNGKPLNFDRLLLKVKATCPPGEYKFLSPEEIFNRTEEQLAAHEVTCGSEAFRKSIKDFLKKLERQLEEKRKFVEDPAGVKEFEVLSRLTNKVCGITEKQLEVFVRTCLSRYHLKRIEAGTAIGAIGAQSIGEPGTQMTLKTFHFAGVASMNITQGVPRIKEIIDAAKKISTPIITAELDQVKSENAARVVMGRIEKTVLGQVAKSIKIVMTSRSASIVITLDMKVVEEACLYIDADTVKESILRTPRIKLKSQNIRVLERRKLEIIPQADRSKIHFELHSLKNILSTILVKGVKTVERTVVAEKKDPDGKKKDPNEKEDSKEKPKNWQLFVEGMGLLEVMGTEGIDGCKTTSNHIIEVQRTLGIEAARSCIISEISYTMESHGMSIDIRHMMLLADVMTYRGDVLGITRFGIQKMDKSVLMLASFEKVTDHLFNASVNGRDDKIQGVSECIIMGIPMSMGTGAFKVRQRVDQLPVLTYGPDPIIC